jgi:hypothetical protein
MGRFVWVEDSITPKGYGRKISWSGLLAQKMKVGESAMFPTSKSAYQVQCSIRHFHGQGAAKVKKHPFCGWRVWRIK